MKKNNSLVKLQINGRYFYVVSFLLGMLLCYFGMSYFRNSDVQNTGIVRKPSKSKYIAPLLLGSDNSFFQENDSFSGALTRYADRAISDGVAKNISIYIKNLSTGKWVGVNENDRYTPASLMKVPIMIAVFKQAETDPSILRRKIYYDGISDLNKDEYYKPIQAISPRHSYSVLELIEYMITYSDNNATVLLLSVVPKDILTEVFSDLGLPVPENIQDGTVDYMSTKLYSRLFRVLYNSTYLHEEYSEKALQILTYPDFPNGIIASIPKGVDVANKFGERTVYSSTSPSLVMYRELHDCGIVYSPKTPYLLCIMTKGDDFKKLELVIQAVSKMVYEKLGK